jgi:hypothetical protein
MTPRTRSTACTLSILGLIALVAGFLLVRRPAAPRPPAESRDGDGRGDDTDNVDGDTVVEERPSLLDFDASPRRP